MTLIYAILLLGILIFVHELGHFLFAKLSNVKAEKFSLGFGPKIFSRKYGETEYILSSVPLGGYVKMLGEEPGEDFDESERHRAFNNQSILKRVSIVLAGPVFNLLFAAFVLAIVYLLGVPRLTSTVGEVLKESPASKAGLIKGDMIFAINSKNTYYWDEMTAIIHDSPEKKLDFVIKRDDNLIRTAITTERKTSKNIFGEEIEVGMIGIKPANITEDVYYGIIESLWMGLQRTWDIIVLTLLALIKLIQRIIPADTIGGPVLIFQMAGQQAEAGLTSFLIFMAVISINLGIINLFPIPVLDGGHIFFLGIEAIRKKPLSEKVMIGAQKAGMALLIALMAFALYNDFLRIVDSKPIP